MQELADLIMTSPNGGEDLKRKLQKLDEAAEHYHTLLDHLIQNGMVQYDNHTLGVVFLLGAIARSDKFSPSFDVHVRALVEHANPSELRIGGKWFRQAMQAWTDIHLNSKTAPISLLKTLNRAVRKARPNPQTATTCHTLVLRVALLARAYHVGSTLCDNVILDIDKDACTARDMLLYFYYAGLIYTGLKQWAEAFRLFRRAVTYPVASLSQITAESFKKMMLVSLLHQGSFSADLPKFTSSVVLRYQKQVYAPYNELCTAYATRDVDEVQKIMAKHFDVWKEDQNSGLVKQVLKSLFHGNIRRNTQTYLTLSLADLARSTNMRPEVAQSALLQMIGENQIYAKIDEKSSTVEFLEKPQAYNDPAAVRLLHEKLQRSISLARSVGGLRDQIEESPVYQQKVLSRERSGGMSKSTFGSQDPDDMGHMAFND